MAETSAFAASSFLAKPTHAALIVSKTVSHRVSTPCMTASPLSRRAFVAATITAAAGIALPNNALAAGRSSMTGEYKVDASQVLTDMRAACELTRGAPNMAETVGKTRKEMNDFVALYRRNEKVASSPSFSTLYTAINTLSGHYASYGSAYPVPEKRKKRLSQQFSEIDRAINRGR